MSPCPACWPTAPLRAARGERVKKCLAPKWLLHKAACSPRPPPRGRQREPRTHSVGCASPCHAGHCGERSSCPIAGPGCPAHVGYTSEAAFRNAFFAGPPALLDCRADGLSLLDPGLPAPRLDRHLQPAGLTRPPSTIAQSQPPPAICCSADLVPHRTYG